MYHTSFLISFLLVLLVGCSPAHVRIDYRATIESLDKLQKQADSDFIEILKKSLRRSNDFPKGEIDVDRNLFTFEPQKYFEAFTHLSPPKDHVLDFVICGDRHGARPILYYPTLFTVLELRA
jgi:hypothetical protein